MSLTVSAVNICTKTLADPCGVSRFLFHEVVVTVADRRCLELPDLQLLCVSLRVCGSVQPAAAVAWLPPAPLHGLRGL